MIPIEYAASGAAFVLHDQAERTPDQYADQIAYVKENRDHNRYGCKRENRRSSCIGFWNVKREGGGACKKRQGLC